MMDRTDRHFRYLLRLITRRTLLYTEMVTTGALVHGDPRRHLEFDPNERPLALQLGGSEPRALAVAARLAEDAGFDEVNLNVGCPSERVKSARFGACLMADPGLVAACVESMALAVSLPVTVKCRIGIDDRDSFDHLADFVATVSGAGCTTFVIHARKAWLSGLSPKKNREIPPLRYDVALRLKSRFPDLEIVLNGGIQSLDEAADHLRCFDGAMIGREAYRNPWMLSAADRRLFGKDAGASSRSAVAQAIARYAERHVADGVPLHRIANRALGLFHAEPGARAWRRALSGPAARNGIGAAELFGSALLEAIPALAGDAA